MHIVDRGHGVPLVLIPGIQGHWEYMAPAIEALAASFRVITFPLAGERRSRRPFDPATGFDSFVDQIDGVLDERGVADAVICGVSFGGVIALRYAAERPARTSALVLVSTPGPGFRRSARQRIYARAPWLFGPAFLAEIPRRVSPELERAIPHGGDRRRFSWAQIRTFFRAPLSLSRMAERSALLDAISREDDCARVVAPTLVVVGETALDRVVPPDGTLEYQRLIAGARAARIDGSGHLGYITKPDTFAALVGAFVARSRGMASPAGSEPSSAATGPGFPAPAVESTAHA